MPPEAELTGRIELLVSSYHRLTGRRLVDPALNPAQCARALWSAPFVVASHGAQADPIFNYGNRAALDLFEMSWEQFTSLPSRLSAEPVLREERQRLLDRVRESGFIDDYSGVRISATGRRFLIRRATVWNVADADGVRRGQAVTFSEWDDLSPVKARSE